MARWMKPTEELPECECGDRILCIVREVPMSRMRIKNGKAEARPTLMILEATESGWAALDDSYAGYSVHDVELWAYEKDVAAIADVIKE